MNKPRTTEDQYPSPIEMDALYRICLERMNDQEQKVYAPKLQAMMSAVYDVEYWKNKPTKLDQILQGIGEIEIPNKSKPHEDEYLIEVGEERMLERITILINNALKGEGE